MLKGLGSTFAWHRCVKAPNALMSAFVRTAALAQGKVTRSTILGCVALLRRIHAIGKAQGPEGLARYLKACHIYVMRYVAGDPLHNSFEFGLSVSLTRSGLPRIIPMNWRRSVIAGSHSIIRLILTFFGLYRVLEFKGKLDISSITAPWTGRINPRLARFVPIFVEKFLPPNGLNTLQWKPIPLRSKGAHVHNTIFSAETQKYLPKHGWSAQGALASALAAVQPLMRWLSEIASRVGLSEELSSVKALWMTLGDVVWAVGPSFRWGSQTYEGELPVYRTLSAPSGRLATKDEPGKVRVFAMVDAWTQWFLYPIHLRIFTFLRTIRSDATFDQDGAVRYMRKVIGADTKVFSFDLSAATDRLPVDLQADLLSAWCPGLGAPWRELLVSRDYVLPRRAQAGQGRCTVRYSVGQPMGAYSSWAMLALTHHLIVQYAASVAYEGPTRWFKDYSVLGDDIVIWDERVAKAYRAAMLELGVKISPSKSLSSGKGVFEFAKRFVSAGEDLTGLPLAGIAASSQNLSILAEILKLLPERSLGIVMRFLGFGFRVRGALSSITFSNARRSFAAFWALQPGLCRESAASWAEWFVTTGPGRPSNWNIKWFSLVAEVADYVSNQRPKMPAEVPFFFSSAYMAELMGSVGSEDSLFPGVPFGRINEVEVLLAALFHGYYSELFVRNCRRVRETDNLLDTMTVPIGPHGIESLMKALKGLIPTSDLLSTGRVQSPAWGEYQDPEPLKVVSVASFIRLRMRARKFLK